jgi:hypothetical protein
MDQQEDASRRTFLRRALALGAIGAGGGTLLSACAGGESGEGSGTGESVGDPGESADGPGESTGGDGGGGVTCDTSGLTPEEKQKRQRFSYVAQSNKPNQYCNNCQFWKPDQVEGKCGGCQLFPGPVNPQGWCNSWVQGGGSS